MLPVTRIRTAGRSFTTQRLPSIPDVDADVLAQDEVAQAPERLPAVAAERERDEGGRRARVDRGRRVCLERLTDLRAGRVSVAVLELVERRREVCSGDPPVEPAPVDRDLGGRGEHPLHLLEEPHLLLAAPCRRHRDLGVVDAVVRVAHRQVAGRVLQRQPQPHLVVEEDRLLVERRPDRVVCLAPHEQRRHADHVPPDQQRHQLPRLVAAFREDQLRLAGAPRLRVDLVVPGEDEAALGVPVEELDPPLQELGGPAVVVVEDADVRRIAARDQPRVVRGRAQVGADRLVADPRVGEVRLHLLLELASGRAVLGDQERPVLPCLREHARDRLVNVGRDAACRDADVDLRALLAHERVLPASAPVTMARRAKAEAVTTPGDPALAPPHPEDRVASDSIARSTFFATLNGVLTAAIAVVLTLYLIRALEPHGYGLYTLALAVGALFALVMDLGISSSAARFIAERRGDRRAIADYVA